LAGSCGSRATSASSVTLPPELGEELLNWESCGSFRPDQPRPSCSPNSGGCGTGGGFRAGCCGWRATSASPVTLPPELGEELLIWVSYGSFRPDQPRPSCSRNSGGCGAGGGFGGGCCGSRATSASLVTLPPELGEELLNWESEDEVRMRGDGRKNVPIRAGMLRTLGSDCGHPRNCFERPTSPEPFSCRPSRAPIVGDARRWALPAR
jgi:hypothetical protein